jgi:hypothetical protein
MAFASGTRLGPYQIANWMVVNLGSLWFARMRWIGSDVGTVESESAGNRHVNFQA